MEETTGMALDGGGKGGQEEREREREIAFISIFHPLVSSPHLTSDCL